MNDSYIKLYRKIFDWQWFKDSKVVHVFLALLLDANYEDSVIGFQEIKRGQVITSLKRLNEITGLSFQEIRTCLSKLEKSGEINKQTTSRYSVISIVKYNDYQNINKQATSKQQASNNIKEYKEYKEEKEYIKEKSIKEKSFIPPTLEEIESYITEKNSSVNAEQFYNFYESKNWYVGKNKMKNWHSAIATWESRTKKSESPWWLGVDIK